MSDLLGAAGGELRQKIREALDGRMATLEQATDAVMRLFSAVERGSIDHDVTTYADGLDRVVQRSWYLAPWVVVGTEEYRIPAGQWGSR